MNLQHERIGALCVELKLSVQAQWPALAQEAATSEASFADFLERVLTCEQAARHAAQVCRHAGGQDPGAV